jgi:hypothetical protein
MRKLILIALLLAGVASGAALFVFRPGRALRVGTGTVAHTLCSEVFVAGLDPQQSFREIFGSMPGIRRIPLLHYEVDTTKREVRATVAGSFESRAVYQEGAGCGIVYRGGAGPRPVLATRGRGRHRRLVPRRACPRKAAGRARSSLRRAVGHPSAWDEGGGRAA